ncbi:MAG: hypothetical protein HY033_02520 [Ignavibacteriae bacterium]|nr:hypothetical protein [Ignavibacteria bacterium]MBI3363761.1 hypothetical protein [Ignavibacteriota bacterium]
MKRTFGILAVATFLITQFSFALPRFALMTGAKCAACHVNPTGGQMRTDYGTTFSSDVLPLRATRDDDFTFSGKLNDNISIGGDYRSQFIYDFATDPSDGQSGKTSFHAMTTTIYGAAKLGKKFTFYFKQDIVNSGYGALVGPEVFGIARILPNQWYIKGGAFLPDYGWRIDDHTSYIRGGDLGFIPGGPLNTGLLFIPNYRDIGVEVGGYIENLFVTASILNGTGNFRKIDFQKDKAFCVKLEYNGMLSSVPFRLGVSGYGFGSYKMGGISAGFATPDSCFVVMGEMDWTHNMLSGTLIIPGAHAMAAYAEADYRIVDGVWAIGKFDLFDPLQGTVNDPAGSSVNSVKRVTLGFEFYPYNFVEVRPQYRINIEEPAVTNDQALIQMHVWF